MKTHKAIFGVFTAMILGAFVITSCSNEEVTTTTQTKVTAKEIGEIPIMRDELWKNVSETLQREKESLNEERAYEILKPAIGHSLTKLRSYGFTDKDFAELLNISENEARLLDSINIYNVSRGIQLDIATAGHQLFLLEEVSNNANSTIEQIKDCFLEATGIAAGVAIINLLAEQALTNTLVIQAIKAAVKAIGPRTLGFVGLGLMAAEFIWCMNR